MEKIKIMNKKLGTILGVTLASVLVISAMIAFVTPEVEERWVQVLHVSSDALGEADPGGGVAGWLATFCIDYAVTPGTALASNASGGGYDSWGNVSGYVDTDDTGTDLVSEDPFYFVVRCRFNDSVKDGGNFDASRCRVALTVSGDETISAVKHIGDNTNTSGGGVVSRNNSAENFIWINFYWDDNNDGYRITDDGSLAWSITIWMRY